MRPTSVCSCASIFKSERSTLISREQALLLLRQSQGADWMPASESELASLLDFEH